MTSKAVNRPGLESASLWRARWSSERRSYESVAGSETFEGFVIKLPFLQVLQSQFLAESESCRVNRDEWIQVFGTLLLDFVSKSQTIFPLKASFGAHGFCKRAPEKNAEEPSFGISEIDVGHDYDSCAQFVEEALNVGKDAWIQVMHDVRLHAFGEVSHRWGSKHDPKPVRVFEGETLGFDFGQVPGTRSEKLCFLCMRDAPTHKGEYEIIVFAMVKDVLLALGQNWSDRNEHPEHDVLVQKLTRPVLWRKLSEQLLHAPPIDRCGPLLKVEPGLVGPGGKMFHEGNQHLCLSSPISRIKRLSLEAPSDLTNRNEGIRSVTLGSGGS